MITREETVAMINALGGKCDASNIDTIHRALLQVECAINIPEGYEIALTRYIKKTGE
jgi:hypothetical protein